MKGLGWMAINVYADVYVIPVEYVLKILVRHYDQTCIVLKLVKYVYGHFTKMIIAH